MNEEMLKKIIQLCFDPVTQDFHHDPIILEGHPVREARADFYNEEAYERIYQEVAEADKNFQEYMENQHRYKW